MMPAGLFKPNPTPDKQNIIIFFRSKGRSSLKRTANKHKKASERELVLGPLYEGGAGWNDALNKGLRTIGKKCRVTDTSVKVCR